MSKNIEQPTPKSKPNTRKSEKPTQIKTQNNQNTATKNQNVTNNPTQTTQLKAIARKHRNTNQPPKTKAKHKFHNKRLKSNHQENHKTE